MAEQSYPDMSAFHALVGRALTDPDFRHELVDHERRKDALRGMGVEPTDEVMEELNNAIEAVERLAGAFRTPQAAT